MEFVKTMSQTKATAVTVSLDIQEQTVKQRMYAIQIHVNMTVYVNRMQMEPCANVLMDTTVQHVTLLMSVAYILVKMEESALLMKTLQSNVNVHHSSMVLI